MKTRIDIKILGAESASIKPALVTFLTAQGYALQCGADTITALKKEEPTLLKSIEPVVGTANLAEKKTFGKK